MPCSELWKACAVPWKLPESVAGSLQLAQPGLDLRIACDRAHAGAQVEGNGDRGELAVVR